MRVTTSYPECIAQCLSPAQPASVGTAKAVPQHTVAYTGHRYAGFWMRERHAAARASMPERRDTAPVPLEESGPNILDSSSIPVGLSMCSSSVNSNRGGSHRKF